MTRKEEMTAKATELMNEPDRVRNIVIAAHIDHGKTMLSNRLIADAGLASNEAITAQAKRKGRA